MIAAIGFETDIPPMTDPLGRYWEQPSPQEILIDATHALMSKTALAKLAEYSCSIPTGTYPGKMWKCRYRGNEWFLVWYGKGYNDDYVSVHRRLILVI